MRSDTDLSEKYIQGTYCVPVDYLTFKKACDQHNEFTFGCVSLDTNEQLTYPTSLLTPFVLATRFFFLLSDPLTRATASFLDRLHSDTRVLEQSVPDLRHHGCDGYLQ